MNANPRDGARARPRTRMALRATLLTVAIVAGALLWHAAGHRDETALSRRIVGTYCTGCHNAIDWDGGIAFDVGENRVDVVAAAGDAPPAALWERAVRKVRAGMMPPTGEPRPPADVLEAFVRATEARLDREARAHPDPGAEPLSRLNRAEYTNAIRDLLDFDASHVVATLPADAAVAGLDNIGDGLSVSPTLIEAYVAAAQRIAREAVGDRAAAATQVRYEPPRGLAQDRHIDGLPLGTRGGMSFSHSFPLDAVYEFHVETVGRPAIATQTLCEPPDVIVTMNGRPLELEHAATFRMAIPAGPQTFAVALLDAARCSGVNDLHDVYSVSGGIRHIEISGPFAPTGVGDTPSRRAIFSCYPETAAEEAPCASEILSRLASHAFRRKLAGDSVELGTLLEFFEIGRRDGDFEAGIESALARMLMSPRFIFQLEREPADIAPGAPFRLDDYEIATRLAFFLWSSLPDAALLDLASRGRLGADGELERQVDRMLADQRSEALTENFAGQWLSLRELREALPQDRAFNANLRAALESETKLLFAHIQSQDRSVLELLDADYTFLNEDLASHYGIGGIHGSYMRRIDLETSSPRRGLLGHGSWLTATSAADRTSPVVRGEWLITHLLGAPVPTPPPGVEADLSDEAEIARADDTLRERLERHRANPTCASCHKIMDPIGLALENFDLVGRWRETDNGKPIDASVVLMDGREIGGPADLREALLARSELFVTSLTEKLLSYAIGRIADYRDMPAVREIVRSAADDGYRFRSIVLGIVESAPFQMRVKSASTSDAHSAAAGDGDARSAAVKGDNAHSGAEDDPAAGQAASPAPAPAAHVRATKKSEAG